ncbi:glycosyl hydrolase, partial [candidate division KSB1 bacterium]|nr:glycosyl hydrolase [candidate division KSB1 bacterium]
MKIHAILLLLLFIGTSASRAVDDRKYVSSHPGDGRFPLAANGALAPLIVSSSDHPGVLTVVRHLGTDIKSVTGAAPEILIDAIPPADYVVIIGTIGKSPIIQKLIQDKKLNVSGIAGRWDSFLLETIDQPMPGIRQALVIAGSNKRGTLYGMFDLSAQIGVSPWIWWADVPVQRRSALYVLPGRHSAGEPAVKYRGIFLNDE